MLLVKPLGNYPAPDTLTLDNPFLSERAAIVWEFGSEMIISWEAWDEGECGALHGRMSSTRFRHPVVGSLLLLIIPHCAMPLISVGARLFCQQDATAKSVKALKVSVEDGNQTWFELSVKLLCTTAYLDCLIVYIRSSQPGLFRPLGGMGTVCNFVCISRIYSLYKWASWLIQ